MSKKKKQIKEKDLKIETDEKTETFRFISILVIVLVVVGIVYGISKLFMKDDKIKYDVQEGNINYEIVTSGTMLNRPYKEYYVMAYDSEDSDGIYYATIAAMYMRKEKALKVYYCDLANKFNKDLVSKDGKINFDAKDVENLSFGKFTLLKIKNGKIVKYVDGVDNVKKELSL